MRPAPPVPDPLQQAPCFARALQRLGREARIVRLFDAGQALVVTRRFGPAALRFTSRGPVWSRTVSGAEMVQCLRQSGLHIVNAETTPADVLHRAGFRQVMTGAGLAILATGDTDAVLARAGQKWRNRARRAAHMGLDCRAETFDAARHGWLFEADLKAQKEKGYSALPHDLTALLCAGADGGGKVFIARQGGTEVAAMVFIAHGRTATYQLGWTSDAGRAASAHHALLVLAATALARDGIAALDLGTLDTEGAPGLARFKLGSGARVHPLGGTWLRAPWG